MLSQVERGDPHTPLKVDWDPESQEPHMVGNGRAQIYVMSNPVQPNLWWRLGEGLLRYGVF